MEASLCRASTSPLYGTQRPSCPCQSYRPLNVTVSPSNTRFRRSNVGTSSWRRGAKNDRGIGVAVECAKLGPAIVAEFERELEEEMNPEGGAEWMRLGRLRDKCGGRKGVVELLECLEREAIMGDDEGKDPNDYNRRAQIFDRSSRVFQALKERTASATAEED